MGCVCQISTKGSAECEARRADARRSRAGKGFLGKDSEPPPHQLRGLGSAVSSVVQHLEFSAFWDMKIASKQCKMMIFAQVFAHMKQGKSRGFQSIPSEHFRMYDRAEGVDTS